MGIPTLDSMCVVVFLFFVQESIFYLVSKEGRYSVLEMKTQAALANVMKNSKLIRQVNSARRETPPEVNTKQRATLVRFLSLRVFA
jgi:hypothetical protein